MKTEFTPEEKLIIDESPEIGIGEAEGWTDKFFTLFPALKNRNYRLYFSGQLVSLIGTWLQIVAQGWLVLQLTNSAFMVGLVAAVSSLPTLLFTLFGGVIVDNFPKRKILVFTQTASMILAFTLGILTVFNLINVLEIAILAFCLGLVNALDAPARQAFAVEMVGKEDLHSAIALNSGIFNGARVIGPSIAGFVIAVVGTGGAFILNGVSYVAVIFALLSMRLTIVTIRQKVHPLNAIKNGIAYSYKHPIIKTVLVFAGVTSIFGWSYTTMMPVIAKNTFHLNAAGLGWLYAATGFGALTATVLVSALSKRINFLVFILGGNLLFSVSIIIFTFTTVLPVALVLLYFAGVGLLSQFSMLNSTIQHMVEDSYRGRVMSLYTLMFLGMSPIGSFQIGFLSEHLGTENAIRIGSAIVLLFGLLIFANHKKIQEAYLKYKTEK